MTASIAGTLAGDSKRDGESVSDLPDGGPVIVAPPAATVSAREPFPWVVAVSAGEQGRWCVTAVRGTTDIADQVGQPCVDQLVPDAGLTWDEAGSDAPDHKMLAWGLAPADQVVVEFADGTRREAMVATAETLGATLWAVGYENRELQSVQALADGTIIAGATAVDGFDTRDLLTVMAAVVVLLAAVAGMRWWKGRRTGRAG